jgi:hypothetical protein
MTVSKTTMKDTLSEQNLNKALKEIDRIIGLSQQQIDLMIELKRSLVVETQFARDMSVQGMTFSKDDYAALRIAYRDALDNGQTTLKFKGREMLAAYARYVLEYIELKLQ